MQRRGGFTPGAALSVAPARSNPAAFGGGAVIGMLGGLIGLYPSAGNRLVRDG